MDGGDKENFMPVTPKKMPTPNTYQKTGGLPSPLSPSKRMCDVNSLESPTKRLQLSQGSGKVVAPPPKMNWTLAKSAM